MSRSVRFSGTGVAMITPFNEQGDVNHAELEKLTERLIQEDVEFLVALGTTSEAPTLSEDEKLEVVDTIRSTNAGRVPLVVGAGGNHTEGVIQWIDKVGNRGIDAYLSVTPYYNKPSQEGMKAHFSAIAARADLPLILYNVPGRTGSKLSADSTLELATEWGDQICATKEATGDFSHIMKIVDQKPDEFQVLSGDDALALPLISIGAEGVISVIGNALPALFSETVRQALRGDIKSSREGHYRLMPFIQAIFKEGNPAGVKVLMECLGQPVNNLRLPLIPATESLKKEMEALLKTLR